MPSLKQLSIAGLLIFYGLPCFSQQDENKIDMNVYDVSYLSVQNNGNKINFLFPVQDIKVYDLRYDTTCLGIKPKPSMKGHLEFFNFRNGLSAGATDYYRSSVNLTSSGTDSVIIYCYIKTFIISDHIPVHFPEAEKISNKKYDADEMSGARFMAEYYYRQGNDYIPICRVDTSLTGFTEITRAAGKYAEEALMIGLKEVATYSRDRINLGKKLAAEEIHNFNQQRFNLPILHQPPLKGIYRTFNDFKNNTPHADEFVVEKNKTGDFLYTKTKTDDYNLLIDLWGYCDGKDIYIYSASNYFKLQRAGNGFKLYGAKDFTARRNLRLNFGAIAMAAPNSNYAKGQTVNKYYLVKSYLQLDMEKGELY